MTAPAVRAAKDRACGSCGVAANVGPAACRSLPRPRVPSARERGRRWPLDATRTELPLPMLGAPIEQDVIVRGSQVSELARALRAVERQWGNDYPACGSAVVLLAFAGLAAVQPFPSGGPSRVSRCQRVKALDGELDRTGVAAIDGDRFIDRREDDIQRSTRRTDDNGRHRVKHSKARTAWPSGEYRGQSRDLHRVTSSVGVATARASAASARRDGNSRVGNR